MCNISIILTFFSFVNKKIINTNNTTTKKINENALKNEYTNLQKGYKEKKIFFGNLQDKNRRKYLIRRESINIKMKMLYSRY